MSERRIINPDEPVDADALSKIIKKGGSVVFDPGIETNAPEHPKDVQRDVYMIPGYKESGIPRDNPRGFDRTVMGPQIK